MSKSIVLKRNSGDGAKLAQMQALQPVAMVQYSNGDALGCQKNDLGAVDYVLATGGHGDFNGKKPTKSNDADIDNFKKWVGNLTCKSRAFILDTCFSSALSGKFLDYLPNGGVVVCAHGSGEGWAEGFSAANGTRTVGSVMSDIVDNYSAMIGAPSIAVLLKKPSQKLLYTMNSGAVRGATVQTKAAFGMDGDTEVELKELDLYLRMEGINVTPTTPSDLKGMLAKTLDMTVM